MHPFAVEDIYNGFAMAGEADEETMEELIERKAKERLNELLCEREAAALADNVDSMHQGVVRRWLPYMGYGFIDENASHERLFFYWSEVVHTAPGHGMLILDEGGGVQYKTTKRPWKGKMSTVATQVKTLDGTRVQRMTLSAKEH